MRFCATNQTEHENTQKKLFFSFWIWLHSRNSNWSFVPNLISGCAIWMIIYLYNQRVFGGNAGSTVTNDAGRTMECNEISPTSRIDTTNPTKSTKVHSVMPTTTKHANTLSSTPSSIDNRRESWWIGLRRMWSRAGTSLRMRRRNFTKLTCMRRRRERLEWNFSFSTHHHLPCYMDDRRAVRNN